MPQSAPQELSGKDKTTQAGNKQPQETREEPSPHRAAQRAHLEIYTHSNLPRPAQGRLELHTEPGRAQRKAAAGPPQR